MQRSVLLGGITSYWKHCNFLIKVSELLEVEVILQVTVNGTELFCQTTLLVLAYVLQHKSMTYTGMPKM